MIGAVVYATLRGLVNDQCFRSRYQQEENWPASLPAIYYQLSGSNEPTICGTDTTDTDDTRAVINIAARTAVEMETLRKQVMVALQSTYPPCHRDGDYVELWNPDTKTHRCILQYMFFASTPASP